MRQLPILDRVHCGDVEKFLRFAGSAAAPLRPPFSCTFHLSVVTLCASQSLEPSLHELGSYLPAVTSDMPFPFTFSEADFERIKADRDGAVAGIELVAEAKERLGDLWPDKSFIEHERYRECTAALEEIKALILEELAETDEERAEYERCWAFD